MCDCGCGACVFMHIRTCTHVVCEQVSPLNPTSKALSSRYLSSCTFLTRYRKLDWWKTNKALMQCTFSLFISVAAFPLSFLNMIWSHFHILVAVSLHHSFATEVGFYIGCISRDFCSVLLRLFVFKTESVVAWCLTCILKKMWLAVLLYTVIDWFITVRAPVCWEKKVPLILPL